MKKLFVIILALSGITCSFSQELVVGGNMENQGSWQTASPMGGSDEATFTFGYTDDTPLLGENGCLSINGLGQTRCLAWQPVTITPGHSYVLRGVFKNSSFDAVLNTWMEVLLSRKAPDPINDYGAGAGDYIYANNTWMTAPWGDFSALDGNLIDVAQFTWKNGSFAGSDTTLLSETIYVPDTVTVTTWYVGLKAGIWNDVGGEPPFIYLFDNISLWDLAVPLSIRKEDVTEGNKHLGTVYPSPTNGPLSIRTNGLKNLNYTLYNNLGALLQSGTIHQEVLNLDLNGMAKGVYFIRISSPSESEIHKLMLH